MADTVNSTGEGEPRPPQQEPSIFDMACFAWRRPGPCHGGLAFFRAESGASTPELCHRFCVRKGLDVSGLAGGSTCRCGASLLNRAVWHGGKPQSGLLFTAGEFVELDGGLHGAECNTVVYRYTGHYEVGAIPFELTDTKLQDVAYIDSLVAGHRLWEEVEEDGTPGSGGRRLGRRGAGPRLAATQPAAKGPAAPGGAAQPVGARRPHALERPGWARHCWPGRCGPGGGPWRERQGAQARGQEHRWEDYAVVRYYFDAGVDDARKEAFREAVARWRSVTCIKLIEEATQPWGPFLMVVVDDPKSCYAWSIGYPGDHSYTIVNMGWCNGLRYVGNIVHEIGHILGMNHEQKRPDAIQMHRGHGPHLFMHWENVPSDWVQQYQADPDSYMGSVGDGRGDPHSGYASYDFESIMQYPSNGRFDTVPAEANALTGQRHRLSDLDVAQILDMYQCRARSTS